MNHGYSRPSIFSTNILYLIVGLLLLIVGFYVQSQELYAGLLVTEYALILIPNLIFIKIKGLSLKRVLRLNGFTLKQLVYTILIVLFSYPIAVFFNMIALNIINYFSDLVPTGVPIPMTGREFLISFFIIGISPGICEEVMFRGTMLTAYEGIGYKKSIFLTAILFGIFHFNITNLVGPVILGIIFAFITIKSNTIFLPMIGHALNNTIALTIGYFATQYTNELDNLDTALEADIIPEAIAMLIATITIGIIALICGFIVFQLIRKFPPTSYSRIIASPNRSIFSYIPVFLVVIIFIVLSWVTLSYV